MAFLLSGCASTSLISSERTSDIPPKSYRKLLVVGLSETPATRQLFEEIFIDGLKKRGADAIPGSSIIGLRGKEKPSREAFAEALKKTSVDGLLVTKIVQIKRKKEEKSGFVMTGRGTEFVDYYDYYGNYWDGIEDYATFDSRPVSETISSVTTLETTLFESLTGKVVWKGRINETHPERLISSTEELTSLILDALSREGLIGN